MRNPLKIDSCICYKLSFSEILAFGLLSLEEIKEKEGVCNKCEMCNPYVEKMLKNGKTEFYEIL